MKPLRKITIGLSLTVGLLAGCEGIGDGNGPRSLELVLGGQTESGSVVQCVATTARARLTFDDGSSADFARRAQWTTSNPSVLDVSDGNLASPDGNFFVNGALIPKQPGTATISVNYLNFSDSIEVTVRPVDVQLDPQGRTVIQGNRLLLVATGLVTGEGAYQSLDLTGLGQWSVAPLDAAEPVTSIAASSGLLTALDEAQGRDTVSFAIDYCGVEKSVPVTVSNAQLQSVEIVRADDTETAISSVDLPPDASLPLRVMGLYSDGSRLNFSSSVSYSVGSTDVAFVNLRGTGVVTSVPDAVGQSTELSVSYDPDSTVEGDELSSNVVTINVLDLSLDPASLSIAPQDDLMLSASTRQFSAAGQFLGGDNPLDWDLTLDVAWSSSEAATAAVSNNPGSRGLVFSSAADVAVGPVTISASRLFGDGPETAPSAALLVGGADAESDPVSITGITVQSPAEVLNQGETLQLSAEANLQAGERSGSQTVTSQVLWESSDESVAVVGNASGNRGLVTVLSEAADQTVTFTARYRESADTAEIADSITITVNPSPEPEPAPEEGA